MTVAAERTLRFSDPLTSLRGVGAKRAESLSSLGLATIEDLLRRAPRAVEDRGALLTILEAKSMTPGRFVTVRGRIAKRSFHHFGGKSTLRVLLEDNTGTLSILWFHAGLFAKKMTLGTELAACGRLSEKGALVHPEFEAPLAADALCPPRLLGLKPLYALALGISQRRMSEWISEALGRLDAIEDPLPEKLRVEADVLPLGVALRTAHRPASLDEAWAGRERLLFDEVLTLELALLQRASRPRRAAGRESNFVRSGESGAAFLDSLPFEATASQRRALEEIRDDFDSATSVERLLAGEVGSGKTVVALAACEEARSRGLQAAFLAPTAILARQHHRTAEELLGHSRVALLLGSMPAAESKRIRADLARGAIDLVIGTQALLSEATRFRRLGIAVVDEQHRFGVEQRRTLAGKSPGAVVLGMSATPIPRTLALLAYPGWEISLLETRPGARGEVRTRLVPEARESDALAWIAGRLRRGEQALFVRPRIEGEDEGARALHRILANGALAEFEVGLVHGAMKDAVRETTLKRFAEGALPALVATTIVEVGIDVPGAAILWIEGAERFGLAQLHQLRGRIARRGQQGTCFLVPSERDDASLARLEIVKEVSDGMRLATIDLLERGPGELLGVRQSGEIGFASGAVASDPEALLRVVEKARTAARAIALAPRGKKRATLFPAGR